MKKLNYKLTKTSPTTWEDSLLGVNIEMSKSGQSTEFAMSYNGQTRAFKTLHDAEKFLAGLLVVEIFPGIPGTYSAWINEVPAIYNWDLEAVEKWLKGIESETVKVIRRLRFTVG